MEHRKVDVLLKLMQVFTLEQLDVIAERCLTVQAGGYGHVDIQFQNGHPRFVTPGQREELPKPVKEISRK